MDRGHGGLTFEEFTKICTDQKSRDFSSSFKKKLSRNETVEKLGGVSEASNEGTYCILSNKRTVRLFIFQKKSALCTLILFPKIQPCAVTLLY